MSDSNVSENGCEPNDSLKKRKEELTKNLKATIIKGLEDWQDNDLATFDFKNIAKDMNIPAILSIKYGGLKGASFTLKYNGIEGEKHSIYIDFNEKNELRCGIKLFFNNPVCRLDDDNEIDDSNNMLQGLKNITDVSFLAKKWFPENNENIPELKLDNRIKKYWPKYHPDNDQLKSWTADHPSIPLGDQDLSEDWAAYILACTIWRVFVPGSYKNDKLFPSYRDYLPKQAITLNPSKVMKNLKEGKGLLFPWHVLEAACSSLNSGKNIIFVGPPGCGKSELALALAAEAGYKTIPVTASSAWSTNELIGRYMPAVNKDSKSHLQFYEGFFLQAITNSDNSWLIIDELNRADIDSCFGELFSVLAGQPALLPFETYSEDSDGKKAESKRIVILPFKEEKEQDNVLKNIGIEADEVESYQVGAGFRIIGTMNDADASKLHQLSYAFQRRFNIIRIDAPEPETIKDIIVTRLEKIKTALQETNRVIYPLKRERRGRPTSSYDTTLNHLLQILFANNDGPDLIAKRIVGVAQLNDIISFVTGSMSGESNITINGDDNSYEGLIYSFTAIGVVMNVFPQLEAFIGLGNDLKDAEKILKTAFGETGMLRLVPSENNASTFNIVAAKEKGKDIKIIEYLESELERQFRYSRIDIEDMINIKED